MLAVTTNQFTPQFRRLASKATLCVTYTLFVYAHLVVLAEDGFRLSLALLVIFETLMVGLVFFRRDSIEVDVRAVAVLAGLVGSFAVLGFRPVGAVDDLLVGQVVQVVGVTFQLGSSLSIGRSFGLLPANRGISTGGLYRLVRHPFYFSYLVTQTGYLLSNRSLWNVAVIAVGLGFQVVRIRFEERLLSRDAEYRAYTDTVRWHLVPGVW